MDAAARDSLIRELASHLEREEQVSYAYLHGSFLDQPAFHDVDIGVQVVQDSVATQVALDLTSRLSSVAGVSIDVRALNGAPLPFRFHALRGRLLMCRDEAQLAEAIEETIRRYLDLAPILRIAAREAFTP